MSGSPDSPEFSAHTASGPSMDLVEQGRTTADESQFFLVIPREYANYAAGLLNRQSVPGDFIANKLEARRYSLECRFHLLASRTNGTPNQRCRLVDTNDDPANLHLGEPWDLLFDRALAEGHGVYSRDETTDAGVHVIAAAVRTDLYADREIDRKVFDLMLAVYHRTHKPDEDNRFHFRDYDGEILRGTLLDIIFYARDEYRTRRSAYDETENLTKPEVRAAAAKRVLEFEAKLGLPTDPQILHTWLGAERQSYVDGDTPRSAFEGSLAWFAKLLAEVDDKGAREELRDLLFDCQLARLTVEHSLPLLSQRIAEARNLAGLEGGAAK